MESQDGSEPPAQLVIMPLVEALEIDFVQVHPWPYVGEDLGGGVSVGDEAGDQAGGLGLAENRDGPLGGDQRFVVGADQRRRTLPQGQPDQAGRRGGAEIQARSGVAQRLRGNPVLAVPAVEVAAQHAEAEGARPGKGVKEGLLLDGIATGGMDVPVRGLQPPAAVETDLANPGEPGWNGAAVAAGVAFDAVPVERPPKLRLPGFAREMAGQDFQSHGGARHYDCSAAHPPVSPLIRV